MFPSIRLDGNYFGQKPHIMCGFPPKFCSFFSGSIGRNNQQ
jgi:hypothetical protein